MSHIDHYLYKYLSDRRHLKNAITSRPSVPDPSLRSSPNRRVSQAAPPVHLLLHFDIPQNLAITPQKIPLQLPVSRKAFRSLYNHTEANLVGRLPSYECGRFVAAAQNQQQRDDRHVVCAVAARRRIAREEAARARESERVRAAAEARLSGASLRREPVTDASSPRARHRRRPRKKRGKRGTDRERSARARREERGTRGVCACVVRVDESGIERERDGFCSSTPSIYIYTISIAITLLLLLQSVYTQVFLRVWSVL